ncbi:DUF5518 domain-containing protein [Salinigranum halophilum]|uniref:DUF5518 domain-containing protein n=1 Tax=Salinigranum halophilum TaxID=2565931 RepID=UPI0010A75501|nr:DUF5518 domain-containing protein [Salinigranum halophilum]
MSNRISGVVPKTWKYALIGGIVSIPLSIGLYWYSGMGNDFSANMVFVGGLLAGYLAKRSSVAAKPVGLRAGLIGSLPGLIWIFPHTVETARNIAGAGSITPAAVVLIIFFSTFVLGIGAVAGFLGGAVGGWLSKKIGPVLPVFSPD